MKKQIAILSMVAALALAGCATHSTSTTTLDANGKPVVVKEKTSQSDNAVMNVIGEGVKIVGDGITTILPPFIPLIVSGLTSPVTTAPANAPAAAAP